MCDVAECQSFHLIKQVSIFMQSQRTLQQLPATADKKKQKGTVERSQPLTAYTFQEVPPKLIHHGQQKSVFEEARKPTLNFQLCLSSLSLSLSPHLSSLYCLQLYVLCASSMAASGSLFPHSWIKFSQQLQNGLYSQVPFSSTGLTPPLFCSLSPKFLSQDLLNHSSLSAQS